MNYQPVIKLDKFGKKKIDRLIVLTSHQILIIYEGGYELQVKSSLDIKFLHYVIKSLHPGSNELMLCFNNKNKSCMYCVLDEDLQEFFDLLKLRWVNFNPDKTLKVYGVKDKSLMQYYQSSSAYNILNLPGEETRLRDEEVISQAEYNMLLTGGNPETSKIDQDSNNFNFENSRGIE